MTDTYTFTAHKLRIYPNKAQQLKIEKTIIAGRALYNAGVAINKYLYLEKCVNEGKKLYFKDQEFYDGYLANAYNKEVYAIAKELYPEDTYLGRYSISNVLTRYKRQQPKGVFPYLNDKDVIGQLSTDIAAVIDKAFKSFWRNLAKGVKGKKAGFPKFKRVRVPNNVGSYILGGGLSPVKLNAHKTKIQLPLMGWVTFRYGRKLPLKFDTRKVIQLGISKGTNGAFYASINLKLTQSPALNELKHFKYSVGIDANVGNTGYVVTDLAGHVKQYTLPVEKMQYYEQQVAKWSRLSDRRFAVYEKAYNMEKERKRLLGETMPPFNAMESGGYRKARATRAKMSRKLMHIRKYEIDKMTTDIARNNNFIVVEKLAVSNMVKNHNLAKTILRSGFFAFKATLAQKATKYGAIVVEVDPKYTSQTCSYCGERGEIFADKTKNNLGIRTWTCTHCGRTLDRDVNAARNILLKGQRLYRTNPEKVKLLNVVKPKLAAELNLNKPTTAKTAS